MASYPCRFFNSPAGCRRGDSCTYRHEKVTSSYASADVPGRGNAPSPSRTRSFTLAPNGICRAYWNTGTCDYGSRCRYAHTATNVSEEDVAKARSGTEPALSNEELARLGIGGIDLLYGVDGAWLPPVQTNGVLRKYLTDDYRFHSAMFIYPFVNCLANVNTQNPLWSAEDRQVFILDFARVPGNGILRIGDVIRWPQVSTTSSFAQKQLILSFQRAYLPLLRFLASDTVLKSTVHTSVNALYGVLLDNFDAFANTVENCMDQMISARSFKDRFGSNQAKPPQGHQIFATLTTVLFECLSRFKAAPAEHPNLLTLVHKLDRWMETWSIGVSATPPTFDDAFANNSAAARDHIIAHIRGKLTRLVLVAKREQAKLDASQKPSDASTQRVVDAYRDEGLSAALHTTWVPPGGRHDNDHEDIGQIRVAPTHDELLCTQAPCLPANIYGAPHHLPVGTMDRHLDIGFRLLREELTAPIRSSVRHVRSDLLTKGQTQLSGILENRGGKYRGANDELDSVLFNVYTGVKFETLTPDRRGLAVKLNFDTPPGPARNPRPAQRATYWQTNSGKRLMQGSLIALAWKEGGEVAVHLGLIGSTVKEISDAAQRSADRISLKIHFFDSDLQFRILNVLKLGDNTRDGVKLLIEAPVMYEAVRPFLEALKTVEPTEIPFGEYIVHHPAGHFKNVIVPPPNYARAPGFRFDLSSLFQEGDDEHLELDATDKTSIALCRQELRRSRLDPSQADAVVDTLTREVALVQGPPGTGKSFTGVELLRVLLAAQAKPILLIAFTNHALDHLLSSALDAGFTKKIIRLGSRSADERISKYSIETLELVAGQSRLDRVSNRFYHELKDVEKEIEQLMRNFLSTEVSSSEKQQHLSLMYPEHNEFLGTPPAWINTIRKQHEADEEEGYTRVRRGGPVEALDNSIYAYWSEGRDLDYIRDANEPADVPVLQSLHQQRPQDPSANRFSILARPTQDHGDDSDEDEQDGARNEDDGSASDSDDESDVDDLTDLFRIDWAAGMPMAQDPATRPWDASSVGSVVAESVADPATPRAMTPQPVADSRPPQPNDEGVPQAELEESTAPSDIPISERPVEVLLEDADMWSMSMQERRRLDDFWTAEIRNTRIDNHLESFTALQQRHADILKRYQEGKDESRSALLQSCDIIGCTTTGAAKLTSLLHGLGPRVMVVEEAGQVLETHVIGSLVPSVQHLILIGDPLQLRPTLNNFALSMDNKRGRELFRFDMSLMERLAKAGFPMSQINVQRRMRPQISNLVRHRLYPALVDNDRVKDYDDVHGMAKNVFFLSHEYPESGGSEEGASKHNTYEVSMIKDLVLYLLRQGCYSQDGDIVVLCMYLGQLVKLRDALSREVVVVIDERDARDIATHEDVDEDEVEQRNAAAREVQVSKQVRLRTVDNFQGEEAKIVILSTVRNAGSVDEVTGARRSTKIGFLKSENRIKVALSRAKEGLYILGNAPQLALRSPMWADVIQQLEQDGCVGPGIPVACHRHPHNVTLVSDPGQLRQLAPDGGCLLPCDYRLPCGHVCPYKCHSDDPQHITVHCSQQCLRLCPFGHPCNKECYRECGECTFMQHDVELPCGHIKAEVPCYLMNDLENVACEVVVEKDLPTCEHSASMPCSWDAEAHLCTKPCDGIMGCCGRTCQSRCSDCQSLNQDQRADDGKVTRAQHTRHPCKKPLFCGHACPLPCARDHVCTKSCSEDCRQECAHAKCRLRCSAPCASCKEACTWTCAHKACPVPCGSVCIRLPCDEPCRNEMPCGHQCPSVCGEDCSKQLCLECASAEQKKDVADMILYRTLADLDPSAGTLDELIITNPKCGHAFTVETLDGSLHLSYFYEKDDESGSWKALKAVGDEKPPLPVCPTCRAPITSPRYSRATRSAQLDVQEKKVVSRMSDQLSRIQSGIERLAIDAMKGRFAMLVGRLTVGGKEKNVKARKTATKARNSVLNQQRETPTPFDSILPTNKKLFDINQLSANSWKKEVQPLFTIYREAFQLASTRSAHTSAWEASFAYLYQAEMELAAADPARAPRRPAEYAMRMARMKVGQTEPLADRRFIVEAIWATLQLRFQLASLAIAWLEECVKAGPRIPAEERREWDIYIRFLLSSAEKDTHIAFGIAKKTGSRKQMTRSILLRLRSHLEIFRANIQLSNLSGATVSADERKKRAEKALEMGRDARKLARETAQEHLRVLPQDRGEWLSVNFETAAAMIVDEWEKLERSLRMDTFYQPLSMDEQTAIVRAFNFTHTGHWYNCPNGHTFVIDDCGGANQVSRCPECGATIGGTGHALTAGNASAAEYENIMRQQGAENSPWPWAQ
ncbi:P-loop containing nucleoside triphosphate hydrolase protein [Schizophyllum commune Tattone D]|nr:P-loop containing nucleoside triphosphate hydrolase protein [Schizophyllum commune Tattone D]